MDATTDPPVFLSTTEAARRARVSEETIRRLAREGHLPARRLYGRSRWRFLLDDVEALLEPRKVAA